MPTISPVNNAHVNNFDARKRDQAHALRQLAEKNGLLIEDTYNNMRNTEAQKKGIELVNEFYVERSEQHLLHIQKLQSSNSSKSIPKFGVAVLESRLQKYRKDRAVKNQRILHKVFVGCALVFGLSLVMLGILTLK